MKHFLIFVNYTAPIEKIDLILSEHRNFLQSGYDKNILLLSGPNTSRTAGIILARSNSLEEIKKFFAFDPYLLNNLASYEFIEFIPVKHQDFLKLWVEDK